LTNLNELQIFVQLAQTRSFTAAARRLDLPKSSVSRSLSRLESRLGVRLVDRTTRQVNLTDEGRIYFERCERVIEEAEQADIEIGALRARPRGVLRVGAPGIFARSILAPALGDFLAMYPDVRLNLLPLDAVPRDRVLDVIIRPGPLEDSGLMVKPLFKIRLALYASPAYLENRDAPATPEDLRRQACVITHCGDFGDAAEGAVWRLRRGGEFRQIRVESRVAVPDPAISQQLALAGVGISVLSQIGCRRDVEQGCLVRLLPEWEPDPVEIHALYSARLSSSPKVRAFIQFLQDCGQPFQTIPMPPASRVRLSLPSADSVS
jgi:DNA-binding transcriptional LysR family regulator